MCNSNIFIASFPEKGKTHFLEDFIVIFNRLAILKLITSEELN